MASWTESARRIERWLLPAQRTACQAPVRDDAESLICDVCRVRWRPIDHPFCARCGEPSPLRLECRVCREWPPDFGPVRSAVRLDSPVRAAVHRFKYEGWWRLADVFATAMAPHVLAFGDADLVP